MSVVFVRRLRGEKDAWADDDDAAKRVLGRALLSKVPAGKVPVADVKPAGIVAAEVGELDLVDAMAVHPRREPREILSPIEARIEEEPVPACLAAGESVEIGDVAVGRGPDRRRGV